MEWDLSTLKRQRSCAAAATTGNWWSRFVVDKEYEEVCKMSTPYYQMGGPRKKGWLGMWKRITGKRKKKSLDVQSNATATDRYNRCSPSYDLCSYMQNFDLGSARLEPENLSRSFSAQFANPSGFLQRMR